MRFPSLTLLVAVGLLAAGTAAAQDALPDGAQADDATPAYQALPAPQETVLELPAQQPADTVFALPARQPQDAVYQLTAQQAPDNVFALPQPGQPQVYQVTPPTPAYPQPPRFGALPAAPAQPEPGAYPRMPRSALPQPLYPPGAYAPAPPPPFGIPQQLRFAQPYGANQPMQYDFGPGVPGNGPAAWIGIATSPAPPAIASQLRLPRGTGVVVENVYPGSPAQHAGIERYDVLVRLDGQSLQNPEQLSRLVAEHQPGDRLTLTLIREGKRQKVEVEVEAPRQNFWGYSAGPQGPRFAPNYPGQPPVPQMAPPGPRMAPPAPRIAPPAGVPGGRIESQWSGKLMIVRDRDGRRYIIVQNDRGQTLHREPLGGQPPARNYRFPDPQPREDLKPTPPEDDRQYQRPDSDENESSPQPGEEVLAG